jgi:hypothetical protein
MRVNVYQEEMGEGVEIVTVRSKDGKEFFGLRIWLKSPQEILDHSTPEDDDRCAVTFYTSTLLDIANLSDQIEDAIERHTQQS